MVSTAAEFVSTALRGVVVGFLLSWYWAPCLPHPIHVSDSTLTLSKQKPKTVYMGSHFLIIPKSFHIFRFSL